MDEYLYKLRNIFGCRPKWQLFRLSVIFSLFLPAVLLYSQAYHTTRYTELNGLPSSTVYSITQDARGCIWMATRSGVSCYDGVSWKNYTAADGLLPRAYMAITTGPNGRIWAMASPVQTIGIHYFDGKRWQPVQSLESSQVTNNSFRGFYVMPGKNDNEPVLVIACHENGLFILKHNRWNHLDHRDGLPDNGINAMVPLGHQCIVATQKGAASVDTRDLITVKPIILGQQQENISSQPLLAMTVELPGKYSHLPFKKPRVWILGKQWLGWFYPGNRNVTRFPIPALDTQTQKRIIHLLPDYRGGIYLGTIYATSYFNYQTRTFQTLGRQNQFPADGCTSLFIDYEKNIWISTQRGVSKISSRRFSNYHRQQGLLEDEVASAIEYQPGKILLGHSHGLTYWDQTTNIFDIFPFDNVLDERITSSRVIDMAMDSQKNIWLALHGAGVAKIDNRQHFTWFGKDPGFPRAVNSILVDKQNKVWMAGSDNLMVLFPGPGQRLSCAATPFHGDQIRKIFGFNGQLSEVGTYEEGVWVRRPEAIGKEWENYRFPGRHNANSVFAVGHGPEDRLLIGTLDGLYVIDKNLHTLKRPEIKGLSIERPIYFIIKDFRRNYWFGTDNGVIRWHTGLDNQESLLTHYSLSEGLIGQETNRAAAVAATNGNILIGTNRGLSVYHRQFDDYLTWNPPPRLYLLQLKTNNTEKSPLFSTSSNQPIDLGTGIHTMVFRFRGISFRDEKDIRFTYKLDGHDQEWVAEQFPYRQEVRYSNLRPGTYRFHIKARNASGVWSDVVHSPLIIIQKPFYNRWWFYLFLVALAVMVLYSILHFISQKRLAKILARQVEERTGRLHNIEAQYKKLFEDSKDGVFVSTPQGKILDINPAGVQLFGFENKEEMQALTSVDSIYYHPKDREDFRKTIETEGFVKDYEIIYKGKDGDPIVAQISATTVTDETGDIVAYRGIIRDFTEKKRLQQQLVQAQKMEAIGTLAGGIAHDFNNILGVILGYTDLVIEDLPAGSTISQNAHHIMTAAKRASELVKQILAFSRQTEQERKPLKLSQIINEALKLLRSSLPATIEIRRRIIAEDSLILADATQIHQVIMNLSTNASHAMRKEGGILEVSLDEVIIDEEEQKKHQGLKIGPYVRLSVSDTGHGIPKFVMKRIFEPYFTTKETGEGTGMGLAMIHGIIKSYGGDISVYSEMGKGTVFHVFFPLHKGKKEEETDDPAHGTLPTGVERVLLIDDEVSLAEVTIQMIQRLGYRVKSMGDPQEAVKEFLRNPGAYDIVITDLTMPKMTGLQVAEEIKKISPQTPVILCSGFSTAVSDQEGNRYIDDFIMKPIIKSQMALMLRHALDKSKKN